MLPPKKPSKNAPIIVAPGGGSAEPFFSHAEPMLHVPDVAETVKYWHEKLAFPNQWTYGDPSSHGGVSWHGAFIQFSYNPEFSSQFHGQSVWIKVRHIDALYQLHQERGAEIVQPLTKRPYGFDEYIVKDLNGYYVTFAALSTGKEGRSETLPETIKIIGRKPTPLEYRKLAHSVGWANTATDEMLQKQLDLILYAVTAENSDRGEAVGCALLFGDGFSFYYIKDVMVHPDWQGKQVGAAMMDELNRWLDVNAADKALVGLFTGENLAPFYQRAHFGPAFGMIRIIDKGHQPNP